MSMSNCHLCSHPIDTDDCDPEDICSMCQKDVCGACRSTIDHWDYKKDPLTLCLKCQEFIENYYKIIENR